MGGHYIPLVWQHDPRLYAPARYRRACKYEAFLPDPIRKIEFSVDAHTAGVLLPLSESRRNRAWEATGLLNLFATFEAGDLPRRDG
jgi:hypothetical protein